MAAVRALPSGEDGAGHDVVWAAVRSAFEPYEFGCEGGELFGHAVAPGDATAAAVSGLVLGALRAGTTADACSKASASSTAVNSASPSDGRSGSQIDSSAPTPTWSSLDPSPCATTWLFAISCEMMACSGPSTGQ